MNSNAVLHKLRFVIFETSSFNDPILKAGKVALIFVTPAVFQNQNSSSIQSCLKKSLAFPSSTCTFSVLYLL